MKKRIYVDVDGVLNFDKKTQYSFTFPAIWDEDGTTLVEVMMDSRHGKWLMDLAEETDSELWWATSWLHQANKDIGPKIGLPHLPVMEFGPRRFSQENYAWKSLGLIDNHENVPFLWFDDDWLISVMLRSYPMPKHTVRLVNETTGLTEADIDFAREWLLNL